MSTILAFPVLIITLMLQIGVMRNFLLLSGSADLMMLVVISWSLQERVKMPWNWTILAGVLVALVSKIPFFVPIISYLLITLFARVLTKHIWQIPVLALFIVVVLGTIFHHGLSFVVLQLSGSNISLVESAGLITFPSLLLNLLFALPVYSLISDLSKWVFPIEIEE